MKDLLRKRLGVPGDRLRRRLVICALLVTPALLTGACSSQPEVPSARELLTSKTWKAEDINGRGVVDFSHTTLEFSGRDKAGGDSGCNRYNTTVTFTEGDRLQFGPVSSTKKGCAPALMNQETDFFAALAAARRYTLDSEILMLYDEQANPLLRFSAFIK